MVAIFEFFISYLRRGWNFRVVSFVSGKSGVIDIDNLRESNAIQRGHLVFSLKKKNDW